MCEYENIMNSLSLTLVQVEFEHTMDVPQQSALEEQNDFSFPQSHLPFLHCSEQQNLFFFPEHFVPERAH